MTKRKSIWQGYGGMTAAGISTFLGAPVLENVEEKELRSRNIKAAVFGVPFDGATLSRTGSSMGPRGIRNASAYFGHYHVDYDVNIFRKLNLHDCGDSFIALGDAKETMENGGSFAAEILKAGAMPVILGGEHTVTLAGTLGVDKALKGNYGFIHFDAHLDAQPATPGALQWFHGSQVSQTAGLGAFDTKNMVLIGMRGTVNPQSHWEFCKEKGITVFTMRQVLDIGLEKVVDRALEIATKGTDGYYLSIDMDVLDPAFVPGAEAFTPFGLTLRELWLVLPKLGANDKLKAFDVVEVVPRYDPSELTALTAAGIVVELLAAKATTMP